MQRVGLRLQLRKRQAEAGDIVLLYGDESEALTHPYLARARAKSGPDLPDRFCGDAMAPTTSRHLRQNDRGRRRRQL
jgi:hypothetical protein